MKKILLISEDSILRNGKLLPGVIRQLYRLGHELRYHLVLLSKDDFPEVIKELLVAEDIQLQYLSPGADISKAAIEGRWDLAQSTMISAGGADNIVGLPVLTFTGDWNITYETLRPKRVATIHRKTNETDILIELNLDGQGSSEIHTGLGFFDHMLDQLARHSGSDLKLTAKGDLHIDEHHTIEDTALALGETFLKALGDKRGIERYGFCLPMDDCLAQVAIDFGGRPWLVWDVEFKREKIGEMPTELFYHFFKSFTDTAKCNLNIKCEGDNEHHKIEAIFKAFAKSIKMAKKQDAGNMQLPSTKGVL